MKYKNDDMVLRIAQGDAYGAAFEYVKDNELTPAWLEEVKSLLFTEYYKHPTHILQAGRYTDDTQMSIGVSEVLITSTTYTTIEFASAFVRVFMRDKRDGYARSFHDLLLTVKSGEELLSKIKPQSIKNGAAMRSVPLGALPTIDLIKRVAETQAKITHDTKEGIMSSQAVGIMSHFALYEDAPLDALPDYMKEHLPEFDHGNKIISDGSCMNTARGVLLAVTQEKDLLSIMREVILAGGDTDSLAAISWGIASARYHDDIDGFWEYGLETGRKYGVKFLKDIGHALMARYV